VCRCKSVRVCCAPEEDQVENVGAAGAVEECVQHALLGISTIVGVGIGVDVGIGAVVEVCIWMAMAMFTVKCFSTVEPEEPGSMYQTKEGYETKNQMDGPKETKEG